jgi:hypothetical protein
LLFMRASINTWMSASGTSLGTAEFDTSPRVLKGPTNRCSSSLAQPHSFILAVWWFDHTQSHIIIGQLADYMRTCAQESQLTSIINELSVTYRYMHCKAPA